MVLIWLLVIAFNAAAGGGAATAGGDGHEILQPIHSAHKILDL